MQLSFAPGPRERDLSFPRPAWQRKLRAILGLKGLHRGYIGVIYRGHIGVILVSYQENIAIMENKMETIVIE